MTAPFSLAGEVLDITVPYQNDECLQKFFAQNSVLQDKELDLVDTVIPTCDDGLGLVDLIRNVFSGWTRDVGSWS